MNTETQKVDVLAVMLGDAETAFEHRVNTGGDAHALYASQASDQARTAVAELIETQRDTLRMLEAAHRQLGMYTHLNKRIQRARAALARIGGAA